jgi:diadenosine tetraphosphatase ApaH/serine/threonine PP2A family protein phosphatase
MAFHEDQGLFLWGKDLAWYGHGHGKEFRRAGRACGDGTGLVFGRHGWISGFDHDGRNLHGMVFGFFGSVMDAWMVGTLGMVPGSWARNWFGLGFHFFYWH